MRRAEGGAKIFGVFRVKNHDFTPKIFIFPILGGAREIFGVFHVKNHDFTPKKIIFLPLVGGTRAGCAPPPPLNPPLYRRLAWYLFTVILYITKDTKLHNFQFKLLYRILPVNSFLYKCGLKETELCTFCMETKENVLHLFWNCNLVQTFWFAVNFFLLIGGIALPLTAREITLGVSESCIENQNTVNNILFILECYIYIKNC